MPVALRSSLRSQLAGHLAPFLKVVYCYICSILADLGYQNVLFRAL
jgi:hypothetical protein